MAAVSDTSITPQLAKMTVDPIQESLSDLDMTDQDLNAWIEEQQMTLDEIKARQRERAQAQARSGQRSEGNLGRWCGTVKSISLSFLRANCPLWPNWPSCFSVNHTHFNSNRSALFALGLGRRG